MRTFAEVNKNLQGFEQQKHYKIRKETIDLINIKCHDFRHQIREIGSNRAVDKETLEEMQDIISIYDSEIATGNKTIDTIMTQKTDKAYHGYGMKSIKEIVNHHDGVLEVDANDGVFRMSILFFR